MRIFFFKKCGDKNQENQEKLLVASIYSAPPQQNKYFLWYLTNLLEFYWTQYEKFIILGDFNIEAEDKVMNDFL